MPIAVACGLSSSAGHRTDPAVGASSPAMRCNRVDFPDPEGPVTAMRAQDGIRQVTSRTACTAVAPAPKVRLRLVHSTTAGGGVTVSMTASCSPRLLVIGTYPSVVEPDDACRGVGDRGAVAGDEDRGAAGGGVGKQVQHP